MSKLEDSSKNSTRMIIGFLGNMRSGKSTSAEYITQKYNYEEKFFAEKLKEICKILFKFNKEQLYGSKKQEKDEFWGISPRSAMQFIGTELFRCQAASLIPDIDQNFWIKVLERDLETNKNYVISDCRMQNEVNFIKEQGGIVIKIIRDIQDEHNENLTLQHISESGIDSIKNYDYIIYNNGSKEDLYKKIDELMLEILNSIV